jgi:hypothetical protein
MRERARARLKVDKALAARHSDLAARRPPLRKREDTALMTIVTDTITLDELKNMAGATFGDMVKAVVDIERGVIAVDAELHSDLEALLLEDGSRQKDLWGVNLYPEARGEEFVEFDSLINMRPSQGNRSRGVDDSRVRKKISEIVAKRIKR